MKLSSMDNASKSEMNRALVIQSYFPELKLNGDSSCQDVEELKSSLENLSKQSVFKIGYGGTSLRFLIARLSRLTGNFTIECSSELASRPWEELQSCLYQLGVQLEKLDNNFKVSSHGWQFPRNGEIFVDSTRSSQFASALLLNSWLLPWDIKFVQSTKRVSDSYFDLTMKICRSLGMEIFEIENKQLLIPMLQTIKQNKLDLNIDLSSSFSLACYAMFEGSYSMPASALLSNQPDKCFVEILEQMGADIHKSVESIKFYPKHRLSPCEVDLKNSPDLFPMLAILCAFADGRSILRGASQLRFKESNRIQKVSELLQIIGIQYSSHSDGIEIQGRPELRDSIKPSVQYFFDTGADHRMAMAAGLLKKIGFNISLSNSRVVEKSFPGFWRVVGLDL